MSQSSEGGEGWRDSAPGDEQQDGFAVAAGIRGYVVGLVLALGLTAASFAIAVSGGGPIWGPGVPAALVVLAIAQMGVHLVFFLHITTGPDNTNNVLALAFGVLIVLLVIGGSLWIMAHLNQNMMPMERLMEMQR
jgi:cytochrome o ubiquinol oxidase operon protein cyoD